MSSGSIIYSPLGAVCSASLLVWLSALVLLLSCTCVIHLHDVCDHLEASKTHRCSAVRVTAAVHVMMLKVSCSDVYMVPWTIILNVLL